MILREAIDVVVEGVEARGGEHAHLAHRPAQHLAHAARAFDHVLATDEHRARGRAQSLGQAYRHRSNPAQGSFTGIPSFKEALKMRAPARWMESLRRRASAIASAM